MDFAIPQNRAPREKVEAIRLCWHPIWNRGVSSTGSAEAVARLFRGEGLLANCNENPRV